MTKAKFTDTKLYKDHQKYLADKEGCGDLRLVVSGVDFGDYDINGMDLRDAMISHSTFDRCAMNDSNLSGAEFSSCEFYRASVTNCTMIGVALFSCTLNRCILFGSELTGARIERSSFVESSFGGTVGIVHFCGGMHDAFYTMGHHISIGCETRSVDEWVRSYQRVGYSNRYSSANIFIYGRFIQMCAGIRDELVREGVLSYDN